MTSENITTVRGDAQEQPTSTISYVAEFFKDEVDQLAWVRRKIEHEDMLVDNRLSWLTTSQAFLFAVYVIGVDRTADVPTGLQVGVPVLGLASSLCIYLGIRAAVRAYARMAKEWCGGDPCREAVLLGGIDGEQTLGNLAPKVLPPIFIASWAIALAYELIVWD